MPHSAITGRNRSSARPTARRRRMSPPRGPAPIPGPTCSSNPTRSCGLIVGDRSAAEGGRALRFEPTRNKAASPYRYEIDPDDLLRLTIATDDAGEVFWGIVHSHTGAHQPIWRCSTQTPALTRHRPDQGPGDSWRRRRGRHDPSRAPGRPPWVLSCTGRGRGRWMAVVIATLNGGNPHSSMDARHRACWLEHPRRLRWRCSPGGSAGWRSGRPTSPAWSAASGSSWPSRRPRPVPAGCWATPCRSSSRW